MTGPVWRPKRGTVENDADHWLMRMTVGECIHATSLSFSGINYKAGNELYALWYFFTISLLEVTIMPIDKSKLIS